MTLTGRVQVVGSMYGWPNAPRPPDTMPAPFNGMLPTTAATPTVPMLADTLPGVPARAASHTVALMECMRAVEASAPTTVPVEAS